TLSVFKDPEHEVRAYAGWNFGTNKPTAPIAISRFDRPNGYAETLAIADTPTVASGKPTGAEAIQTISTLSRSYTNKAGQVTNTDAYFKLDACLTRPPRRSGRRGRTSCGPSSCTTTADNSIRQPTPPV